MRPLLGLPFFLLADGLIVLAKLAQKLAFVIAFGCRWRQERDRCYREGIAQSHFRMNT
jgi:hypothetical protein